MLHKHADIAKIALNNNNWPRNSHNKFHKTTVPAVPTDKIAYVI